jgi:hypothetical protein
MVMVMRVACTCFRFWITLSLLTLISLCTLNVRASDLEAIPLYVQESLDANGKPFPISPGLAKFITYFEHELGVRFQISQIPWNRAKMLALQGDGIIWAFSKTAERLQNYQFSETVMLSHIWAVAYGDPHLPLRSISDLKGETVSVERGVSHGMAFENARNIILMLTKTRLLQPYGLRNSSPNVPMFCSGA